MENNNLNPGDTIYFLGTKDPNAYVKGRFVSRSWLFGWNYTVEYDVDCFQDRDYDTKLAKTDRVWTKIPEGGRQVRASMGLAEAAKDMPRGYVR